MATILCPTRGGEYSYPNQDRAIAIARERGADLVFLYVSNVRFLGQFASPILVDVETELDEMGEFMLTMAQERAEKAGVQARTVVRRGVFRHALKEVIEEQGATTVVLGSPSGSTAITSADFLEELAHMLKTEARVEVIVVGGGETVAHHASDAGEH